MKTVQNYTYHSFTENGKEWFVTKHMIGDFPREGKFSIDKHGAQVFNIPKGMCEILSFDTKNTKECWAPIVNVTAHEGADCVCMITVGSKFIETTANESVGIFDNETGGIEKVRPDECSNGKFIPTLVKEPIGNISNDPVDFEGNDFQDGWMLASMVSDGWVSERYVGYSKNDTTVFNKVHDYLIKICGPDRMHIHTGDKENGDNKFGRSVKLYANGYPVVEAITKMNLYGHNQIHDALYKSLGFERILKASKDFLFGVLCGMADGDGCIVDQKGVYELRLYTSSKDLVNDIRLLSMRLGIRCTVIAYTSSNPAAQQAYVISFNKDDIYANVDNMMFYSEKNRYYHCCMLSTGYKKLLHLDRIPLTIKERDFLRGVSLREHKPRLYEQTNPRNPDSSCTRETLKDVIHTIDKDSALYNRIMNENVRWVRVRKLIPMGKQPVFDFEVEGTKTFFVNENILTYDTVSVNGIISKEANEEVLKYLDSPSRYIKTNGTLSMGTNDLQKLTMWNLSRDPEEEIKK